MSLIASVRSGSGGKMSLVLRVGNSSLTCKLVDFVGRGTWQGIGYWRDGVATDYFPQH